MGRLECLRSGGDHAELKSSPQARWKRRAWGELLAEAKWLGMFDGGLNPPARASSFPEGRCNFWSSILFSSSSQFRHQRGQVIASFAKHNGRCLQELPRLARVVGELFAQNAE